MLRFLSLAIRRFQSSKKKKKVIDIFTAWKSEVANPVSSVSSKKLLLIRLDDIGDYILFRNFLSIYQLSAKWKDYQHILLGNIAWKNLYENFDANKFNKIIWVDKAKYFNDAIYRKNLWQQLYKEGFEIVICPSRTRQLLLDDVCALATAATKKIGVANTLVYKEWNTISDVLYDDLFRPEEVYIHDFIFNKLFTEWCCDLQLNNTMPLLEDVSFIEGNELIFFIGANSGSKRWPVKRWIELAKLSRRNYSYTIEVAGGKNDVARAELIAVGATVNNIAGKYSLTEMINKIAAAKAVITNDTMAVHAAVACNKPVVIIANGNNNFRFTDYDFLDSKKAVALYPQIFLEERKKHSIPIEHYEAVSADIATITAKEVFAALQKLIN